MYILEKNSRITHEYIFYGGYTSWAIFIMSFIVISFVSFYF